MNPSDTPIAVVGAGTVGSILIGHLLKAGYDDIYILDVPKRIEQIREKGILLGKDESIAVNPGGLVTDFRELEGKPIRTIIVSTKATDLPKVCPGLQKIHRPGTWVVSFQNGIGTENYIGKYVDPMWVARATVNYAGVRNEDSGDIAMSWFHPPNFIGPWQVQDIAPLERFAALLTEVGLESRAVARDEMKRMVFFKAILNAALNALCATTGLTMSQAMEMKHTRLFARQLLQEGLTVGVQMGYHYGEDVLETCIGYLNKGGNHFPSMWNDLQRNRRTEIDFINGKIVKLGMMFRHVSVDLNMFFTTMVMTREILSGVRTIEEVPDYLGCPIRHCY
ncbi:MAG: 2-dehydropantoate 2-reductase [Planctomycetes bacterium]|nr:2-dehydropantoate 2-reductase [Planctomycetota bacterium]